MGKGYRVTKANAGSVKLMILQPKNKTGSAPGILWIHGGGYATGGTYMVRRSRAADLVKKYGAVVISPAYRLSWKAPYPAALEDCYEALKYLKDHAEELGCDPDQIMVGGESAGGGLAAALCMSARDKGEVSIAYQMPLYPMIDDRDTDSSRSNYRLPWNTLFNHGAWDLYLGDLEEIPPYAAPARQTDYTGLPPAYTFVGHKEPFYCETLSYIESLQKAGVEAKVDVYPTGIHAFDVLLPFWKLSKLAAEAFEKQFLYAKTHYFAPQPKNDRRA